MAEARTPTPIVRRVLEVARKERVTPHLLRVVLTGDAVADFRMVSVGVNNKLFIPPARVSDVHFPEFVDGAWVSPDASLTPHVRTYTLRALDLAKREMSVDFALHGDGVASVWAENAAAGDKLGVAMKAITKQLYPRADHYLIAADLSAVPVTSVILETLPPESRADVVIEVPDEADIHEIETRAEVNIKWIVNPEPGTGTALTDAVKAISLPGPDAKKFAHIAAEFSVVREMRNYFREEKGWSREEFHGFGYWKHGVAEDHSAVERHDESHS